MYGQLRALKGKSRWTVEHQYRVAGYCRPICKELDLAQEFAVKVCTAAEYHDIGKLGVPNRILTKPSPLNFLEMALIRLHPRLGSAICRREHDISQMILSHHERYDGKGYPRRLQGEDIPLGGRIIAVADKHDSRTHQRPYNKDILMTPEEAIAYLKENSATIFDPEVVEAFINILKK
jgi:HD-GYP domain-containing protein (c-di-GMP phosphodiesterase class II)